MFSYIEYFINHPVSFIAKILTKFPKLFLSDSLFLQLKYKSRIKRWPDLIYPKSFNEKLQWLKLNDRRPKYTNLVDKYEVKRYVSKIIGDKYIIPTLAVYNSEDEIDFNLLPEQFVLKCTHDSGGIVICRNKKDFNVIKAKDKLKLCLKNNYFWKTREWPYKNIRPRIIAEKYMEDESGELRDYKLMCFNGKVMCSFVVSNRFGEGGLEVDFYDRQWNLMPFTRHYPNSKDGIACPKSYELMVSLAEKLAGDIPFVRVDFYEIGGVPYFGEMTFYPGSGFEEFTPEEWDYKLGSWLKLPK